MKNFLLALMGALALAGFALAGDAAKDLAIKGALRAHATTLPSTDGTMIGIPLPVEDAPTVGVPGVPTFLANFIATGTVPPLILFTKIPCWDCIGNPPIKPSLGLTGSLGYIPTSLADVEYTIVFQDVSHTGDCSVSFALMQGSQVIDAKLLQGPVKPNTRYLVLFNRARPAISGQATLVGTVKCGVPFQTVTADLYFQ